jgi:meso-butanediol dehydrogenase/(S,S)-butanediol dehydrogenase/diacetyl reductase
VATLEGMTAIVTGAASGIGAATVRRFTEDGAVVVGFDVQEPVEPSAAVHGAWSVDVRDAAAIEAAVAAAVEAVGPPDVLVNAAGVSGFGGVVDLDEAEWDRVLDINLKGTYLVSRHVLPHLLAKGKGSVINLASVDGLEGMNAQAAYNASKGGVVVLTKNMAIDYGPQGVRVNCLCPGLIRTPLTEVLFEEEAMAGIKDTFVGHHPLGRPGRPEEVAAVAAFLAGDDASFVNGHALTVDGGYTAGRTLG